MIENLPMERDLKLIIKVVVMAVVIVGIPPNLWVILHILKKKRTIIDYFPIYMAISDLGALLFEVPDQLSNLLSRVIQFPSTFCVLKSYLGNVFYMLSNLSFYTYMLFRTTRTIFPMWAYVHIRKSTVRKLLIFDLIFSVFHYVDYLAFHENTLFSMERVECFRFEPTPGFWWWFHDIIFKTSFVLYFITTILCLKACYTLMTKEITDNTSNVAQRLRRKCRIAGVKLFLCHLMFTIFMGIVETPLIDMLPESLSDAMSRAFGYLLNPLLYYMAYRARQQRLQVPSETARVRRRSFTGAQSALNDFSSTEC